MQKNFCKWCKPGTLGIKGIKMDLKSWYLSLLVKHLIIGK